MIGIIFATPWEAKPFLTKFNTEMIQERPFPLYSIDLPNTQSPALVVISGIGKVPAALAAQSLILGHNINTVVNVGICGALAEDIETGMLFRILKAMEGDRDADDNQAGPFYCSPELWPHLHQAKLVSNDKPVFDKLIKEKLAQWGDLVDMEGAAIARTAHLYGIKCALIKGVTDKADEEGKEILFKNIKKTSIMLANILWEGLTG